MSCNALHVSRRTEQSSEVPLKHNVCKLGTDDLKNNQIPKKVWLNVDVNCKKIQQWWQMYESMQSIGWMVMTGKNHSTWITTCPTISLVNANHTQTVLGLNLGLHGEGPVTKCLSRGMAHRRRPTNQCTGNSDYKISVLQNITSKVPTLTFTQYGW